MTARRAAWMGVGAVIFIAGCVAAGGAAQDTGSLNSTTPTVAPADSSGPSPAIDPTISAVSATAVGSAAANVLDACGINYTLPGHSGNGLGLKVVSGMGLIPHARDVGRYAALGPVPELQNAAPAWVVTTSGWYTIGLSDAANGIESKDPTCVVLGDDYSNFMWFSTGGTRRNGVISNAIVFTAPVASLPTLLP